MEPRWAMQSPFRPGLLGFASTGIQRPRCLGASFVFLGWVWSKLGVNKLLKAARQGGVWGLTKVTTTPSWVWMRPGSYEKNWAGGVEQGGKTPLLRRKQLGSREYK